MASLNLSAPLWSQQSQGPSFNIQLDSRTTLVNKESVGIFGVRAGLLFENKYELGLGLYGSRLFNSFGTEVQKDYVDNNATPAQTVAATVGFDYLSLYGEYVVLKNNRWQLTVNSQFGIGRVNIRTDEPNQFNGLIRERKSLIEHSAKAKYKATRWLYLIGGLGYRYLLSGEKQIQETFNAPIYILSTEIDFKQLLSSLKKKGN